MNEYTALSALMIFEGINNIRRHNIKPNYFRGLMEQLKFDSEKFLAENVTHLEAANPPSFLEGNL